MHIDSCGLYWLDVFLLLEIIWNFISLLNYQYRFRLFQFYIGWKIFNLGITYIYVIGIINLYYWKDHWNRTDFLYWKEYPLQKYSTETIFLFTIYHMIYRHTSKKVHHMWQLLISLKWKINLLYFKINLLFHTAVSETSQISRWRLTQTQIT